MSVSSSKASNNVNSKMSDEDDRSERQRRMKVSEVDDQSDSPTAQEESGKKKRKILIEEDYLDAIDFIVQRDFYSDLTALRLQDEWLEAWSKEDYSKIVELRGRIASYKGKPVSAVPFTPSASSFTPQTTPSRTPERERYESFVAADSYSSFSNARSVDGEQDDVVSVKLGLDSFVQQVTSEDDVSFNEIMRRENEIKREILERWSKKGSQKEMYQKLLLLTSSFEIKPPSPITWKKESRPPTTGLIMGPPDCSSRCRSLSEICRSRKSINHAATRFSRKEGDESINSLLKSASVTSSSSDESLPPTPSFTPSHPGPGSGSSNQEQMSHM